MCSLVRGVFQQACLHHHLKTNAISFQSLWQSHPWEISQPVSACLWSPTVRSALGLSLQLSWAYADVWDSEQKTVSPPTCWYWLFLCPLPPTTSIPPTPGKGALYSRDKGIWLKVIGINLYTSKEVVGYSVKCEKGYT